MWAKYNDIGKGYNSTRKADPFLVSRFIAHLMPVKGRHYLDIGCGTGNYTCAIQRLGFDCTGIDPSEEMLRMARIQSNDISWIQGSAEAIPLASMVMDGCIACLTLHHWANLNGAFKEVFRVLKPGSRWVIFTSTPEQMQGYWLNHYFPSMLSASSLQMPDASEVAIALKEAGFEQLETEKYFIQEDLQDLFLYAGKQKPQLYLSERVRQGISSFAALALADEVQSGLVQLERDIQTGLVNEIIQHYLNDLGDYVFIVAMKN